MRNLKAFTLAETLITLVIVGVIAAISIPTLFTQMQYNQYKSAYKKAYSNLTQAYNKVLLENSGTIKDLCTDSIAFRDLITTYMNTMKVCDQGVTEGCRYSGAKGQSGATDAGFAWMENVPAVVLDDGDIMQFYLYAQDCSNGVHGCGIITIDINGMRPPNRTGVDVYPLHIKENVIKPFGADGDGYADDCDYPTAMGWTCAAKRLKE